MRAFIAVGACVCATFLAADGAEAPIEIGNRLQVLWDDVVVDTVKTTASRRLHAPSFAGVAYTFDAPWEKGIRYCHVVRVADPAAAKPYRLYYVTFNDFGSRAEKESQPYEGQERRVCFLESADGLAWTRPDLGLVEYAGSSANNIILNERTEQGCIDGCNVFCDENPDCPADERYKALLSFEFKSDGQGRTKNTACGSLGLRCYVSADGIRFRPRGYILRTGLFDSLNLAFWHAPTKEYRLYFRSGHCNATERNGDIFLRDIRYVTSKDFRTWSEQRRISFLPDAEGNPAPDYPLYTNAMQPYPRAPELCIGFPTRYVQRARWTPNYDRLPSPAERRVRMDPKNGGVPRYGLVTTDCVFMMTRDGATFHREEEAFLRPGPERASNWRYGDCYPAVGLVPTLARQGDDPVYSFYVPDTNWWKPAGDRALNRYEVRQDGFVSRHATYAEQRVVTKELVFAGTNLLVNFSTSARGYLYVTVRDRDGVALRSTELFGDKVDRPVGFTSEGLDLGEFAGKPVTLEFTMSDADLYSFRFKGDTFRDHPRRHSLWGRFSEVYLKHLPDCRETGSSDGVTTFEVDGLDEKGNAGVFTCRFARPEGGALKDGVPAVVLVSEDAQDLNAWRQQGFAILHLQPSTGFSAAVNLGLAHTLLRNQILPQSSTSNLEPPTFFIGLGRGADLGAILCALDKRFSGFVLVGGGTANPARTSLDNGRFLHLAKSPVVWVAEEETSACKRAFAECPTFAGFTKAKRSDWTETAIRLVRAWSDKR